MSKQYKIRDGFTFKGDDGQLATGGDTIELEDDVAAQHEHKLELIETPKRRAPAKQAAASQEAAGTSADDTQASAQEEQPAALAADPAGQQ